VGHESKRARIKGKLLLVYLRRNIRLALTLSVGALILVTVAASSGGFCYITSKKAMSLAAKESPVDAVFRQDFYVVIGGTGRILPYPYEFFQLICNETDVVDAYALATVIMDLNVTVNRNDTGLHRVMIVAVGKMDGFNVTLIQGSQIESYSDLIVSEGFSEEFNVTLEDQVKLIQVISQKPLRTRMMSGYATGVTPKHFSQLTEELGLHDSLLLAGYTESQLLSYNAYPFVLVNITSLEMRYFLETASQHYVLPSILATFFVKFDENIYLNPWDTDITIFNLNKRATALKQDMNNFTLTRMGYEYNAISITAVPAANVFQDLSQFINISRLTVIAFGATVAFVGWYFYSSVSKATISARTRELHLMRIRGIPQKSITRSISLIVVASGIIGSAAGLLLGFIMTTEIGPPALNTTLTEADIAQTFGIASLLFYAFFGLAASLISQRQALSAIKTVTPKTEEMVVTAKTKMSLSEKAVLTVAIILGTVKVADWLLGINFVGTSQTANPITSAVMLFFRLVDQTVLDALGALLLIYAAVTIISRRPRILSSISQWISAVVSPRLSMVSKKLMSVKSAKMAGVMIVVSLLVFNTVSTNMGYSGVQTAWKDLSRTVVGADIRIDVPEEAAIAVVQQLDNISSVEEYTQIFTIACGIGSPLGTSVIYSINTEGYAEVLNIGTEGLESIRPGEIVVSEFFREMGLLSIGDEVSLNDGKELTVRGFIKSVPGLLSVPPIERFAVMNEESVQGEDYVTIIRTFLVKLNGSQPDAVTADLMSRMPENIRLKLSTATESRITSGFGGRIAAPLIVDSVVSMLFVASVVGVVFAAMALGVMGYNESVDRKSLDALLRVKGVKRWQLLGMAFSEALCILVLSLLIGFLAGYAMASGYTSYFSAAFPINASPTPSFELATQMLALIVVYLLAFLAPTINALRKTAHFSTQ
jgi:ABC-type antimicrobial peptide transport system permease subunit